MSTLHRTTRVLSVSILACLLVVHTGIPSEAFDSYPVGSEHDQITGEAAKNVGFSAKTIKALQKAVRAPDWDESSWKHWLTYVPNAKYSASHHFDRGPGKTDKEAFNDSAKYVREQKQEAIDKAKQGDQKAAIAALGRALHALQDLKAHSNYVDLTADQQQQTHDAVFDPAKMPPDDLKLAGFDPAAADPGKPPGDPYSHDDFAKDNPTKNAESQKKIGGKTKFELAKAAAVKESEDLLKMVKNEMPEDKWNALIVAVISPDPNDAKYAWATLEGCGSGGCVLLGEDGSLLDIPAGALGADQEVGFLGVPDNFFYSADQVKARDNAWMVAYWEIRVESEILQIPAQAETLFSPDRIQDLERSSLGVYYWSAAAGSWQRLDGAEVSAASASASFPVAAPGVYAVGGRMTATEVEPRPVVPPMGTVPRN